MGSFHTRKDETSAKGEPLLPSGVTAAEKQRSHSLGYFPRALSIKKIDVLHTVEKSQRVRAVISVFRGGHRLRRDVHSISSPSSHAPLIYSARTVPALHRRKIRASFDFRVLLSVASITPHSARATLRRHTLSLSPISFSLPTPFSLFSPVSVRYPATTPSYSGKSPRE